MSSTIQQMLSKATKAHEKGHAQEAKNIYLTVLEIQPMNPDANHNMGLLTSSDNKLKEALHFFKMALDANPKSKQFWLSYIIILKNLNATKKLEAAVEAAEKHGLSKEYLHSKSKNISMQLTKNTQILEPPPKFTEQLFKCFQAKRFEDAEKLSRALIIKFPCHVFSWKILGSTLVKMGKTSEAVKVNAKVVALSPLDHQAHFYLGLTLHKLGRLNDAEKSYKKAISIHDQDANVYNNLGMIFKTTLRLDKAEKSYKKAISLNPKFAEAYNNLGSLFRKTDRLREAEENFKAAVKIQPKYVAPYSNLGATLKDLSKLDEAKETLLHASKLDPKSSDVHFNLGVVFFELGMLGEAEKNYQKAISLDPNNSKAYNNLGITYHKQGKLEKAETSFKKALLLDSNYAESLWNLAITLDYKNSKKDEIKILNQVRQIDPNDNGLRATINLAIHRYTESNFSESKELICKSSGILNKTSPRFKSEQIYRDYLSRLIDWHECNNTQVSGDNTNDNIFVIGESHSLASHALTCKLSGSRYLCKALLIKGVKQWDLGNSFANEYKKKFEMIFSSLPQKSIVLFTIGEIDCRLNNGILKHLKKNKNKDIREIAATTIENYLEYVLRLNSNYNHDLIFQGVPCPNLQSINYNEVEIEALISLTTEFNEHLKMTLDERGLKFLDVHKMTNRGDGWSNSVWHIDDYHLSPKGVLEAWQHFLS